MVEAKGGNRMSNIGVWENAEPGVTRKILQPGKTLMLMEVHFEPGAVGYEHAHPHEQLSYCLKGAIEFTIDGEKQVIRQGESVVIPSGARHGVTALEASALLDSFTPLRDDLIK
jgi:quercetin dioxygenase-like cupin family protein